MSTNVILIWMKMKNKIFVVMPAYNAQRTLEKVYGQIPKSVIDKILLVDDGSKDETIILSKKLGIETIIHKKNLGYGENQKTCYDAVLKQGAAYIIMLHPDGQYDGADIPLFVDALKKGADFVLGSRFLGSHHKTPFYKSISIRFLTFLFNLVLRTKLTEANTGYRGFSRKFLETIPYHKNGAGYIFDPQVIIQATKFGFSIKEVPVTKDYLREASSPNFYQSVVHGLENVLLLAQYISHLMGIKKAMFLMK